jgi:hypothetical protein
MSESPQTRSPRSWRRLSGASLAIAMGTGSIAAIAATPASQAESSASLVVSPSHKPVIAQTSCDSDAGPRAKTQTVLRNRGDRPGVTVTYSVAGAKPRSPWDFRVSVTSSGDSGFGVGQDGTIRADRQGHWSFKLTVANEGRYRAKSRLGTLSGNQHCFLRITAAP